MWTTLFKVINSCTDHDICSTSMNSAGWPNIQVPWPSFVPWWLSRRATAMLFINVFTLIITVSIAAEEPSVVHAKVVLHKSSALVWFWLVRAYLSNAVFSSWCLNVPFASNLSRICYEVMPRQWCRTGCLRSVGTKRHNTALETRTGLTKGRKRLDGLLSLEFHAWLTLESRPRLLLIQCLMTLSHTVVSCIISAVTVMCSLK